MGEVTLTWDEDLTTRDALAEALSSSGFHERMAV